MSLEFWQQGWFWWQMHNYPHTFNCRDKAYFMAALGSSQKKVDSLVCVTRWLEYRRNGAFSIYNRFCCSLIPTQVPLYLEFNFGCVVQPSLHLPERLFCMCVELNQPILLSEIITKWSTLRKWNIWVSEVVHYVLFGCLLHGFITRMIS